MPIYKGTNEVTSGNLYKGSTEIQDGYKATNPFYVNETTLTIEFVNNTGLSVSSGQLINTLTGVPGQAINNTPIVLAAASSQRLNSLSFSESGDTGGNLSGSTSGVTVDGGTMTVSGTFPTTSVTVTYTLTASVTNLTAITATADGSPQSISCCNTYSSGTTITGAGINGEIRFSGFSSYADADAARAYISQSASFQPVSGSYTVTQQPVGAVRAPDPNFVIDAYFTPPQYQVLVGSGGITFGSAGQTASHSAIISKNSGYYISSGTNSYNYMQYV
jgi:hypothetical protein